MNKTLIAALLGTLLAAPTLALADDNLVVNGSFEATAQGSGSWAVYNTLPGWTTTAGAGIELRNNVVGTAFDGSNFVELDSHNNSSMQQTIATQAGRLYDLSFFYSARPNVADAGTNGIAVAWNGTTLLTVTGAGASQHHWIAVDQLQVLGTGSDRLTFSAIGTSNSLGGSLDAVSLTAAVPEPGTYALMAAGLLAVGFIARRRNAG